MLRTIRIALATVFFAGITLLFLDVTGTLHTWLGWMAKIQFLPAVLALNVVTVAVLAVLTLLFGRVYCSVICPLGVMQDIISWAHGRTKKKTDSVSAGLLQRTGSGTVCLHYSSSCWLPASTLLWRFLPHTVHTDV